MAPLCLEVRDRKAESLWYVRRARQGIEYQLVYLASPSSFSASHRSKFPLSRAPAIIPLGWDSSG